MIKSYLESRFKINRLYNSWLIQTADNSKALNELNDFICTNLLGDVIPLETHPDFKLIEKPKTGIGSKNITVEQIRTLQGFLNKTSGISNYKVGIIYEADSMNLNAANSCLKILEDTPKNSYIFLITEKASHILPTIRSRCAKIRLNKENQEFVDDTYIKYTQLLLKDNLETQLNFLTELSEKNRELWLDFSEAIINFMGRIIKRSIGIDLTLNEIENKVADQFRSKSTDYLIKKLDRIRELTDNTVNYDLDMRASYILLIEQFKK